MILLSWGKNPVGALKQIEMVGVEVCEKVFEKEAVGVLKQKVCDLEILASLFVCVCVLKLYIQYIHSCLC